MSDEGPHPGKEGGRKPCHSTRIRSNPATINLSWEAPHGDGARTTVQHAVARVPHRLSQRQWPMGRFSDPIIEKTRRRSNGCKPATWHSRKDVPKASDFTKTLFLSAISVNMTCQRVLYSANENVYLYLSTFRYEEVFYPVRDCMMSGLLSLTQIGVDMKHLSVLNVWKTVQNQ